MKIRRIKISLVGLVLLSLIFSVIPSIQTKNQIRAIENQEPIEGEIEPLSEEPIFEEPDFPEEPSIPGRIEGTGTYFEIQDSEYLNIILRSTEEIKIVLESIPRMISLDIEVSPTATSTELTLEVLEPGKTYYKYQDSYKNEAVFLSDEKGSFSWEQDLSQPRHIWLQEEKGTIFISIDTTLTSDLTEGIEIIANNITLDCNGHKITGTGPGYGIYLNNKKGVTIKNCIVANFWHDIYLYNSLNNILTGNTVTNPNNPSASGIFIVNSPGNTLIGNTADSNRAAGFYFYKSGNSTLINNTITDNQQNFALFGTSDEDFINNVDTTNTVDGKPIYYLLNATDQVYDETTNVGIFYCIFCNNIAVKNLTLTKNSSVFFWKTQNSKIEKISPPEVLWGIFLRYSNNNTVLNNRIGMIEVLYSDKNTLSNNESLISLRYSNNNILINNTVKGGWAGIYFLSSNNNTLDSNNANYNKYYGIYLESSSENILINNNTSNNVWGIALYSSSNNTLEGNLVSSNNSWGIFLSHSPNSLLRNNNILENRWNFAVYGGTTLEKFIHDIDTSNKVNGKAVHYLVNKKDLVIDSSWDIGYLGIVNSTNIIVKDLTLNNNGQGMLFAFSNNSKIENVKVSDTRDGILLINQSANNTLINNNASNNIYGIPLVYSSNNNILINNNVSNNYYGVDLTSSSDNILNNNDVSSNQSFGIYFYSSSNNTIINNAVLNNGSSGISFYNSYNNKIYHNNFLDNGYKPQAGGATSGNFFDNGYPDGGNFWSDYTGVDLYAGPNQDQPGSDGIGDTPYTFFYGGQDRYPFIAESGWEAPPEEPEKWSFVLITDLHIGWGIPDYDSENYNDSTIGQEYYMTERFRKTVKWINDNYKNPDYNIKFVVVTGDISDTAEYSEFLTAREILNELEIPYIPLIGNHDIWPYIGKTNVDPDNRIFGIKDKRKGGEPLGDEYFEKVFWQENSTNTQKIESLFDYFERQEEKEGYQGDPYFQNYAFSYGEINFISLDFAPRDFSKLISSPLADLWKEITLKWFDEKLKNREGQKVIALTHYPFKIPFEFDPLDPSAGFWWWDRKEISDAIRNCNCKVFNFAGHTHINAIGTPGNEYDVVETEPASQIPVHPTYNLKGEFIRLVQVIENGVKEINYETLIDGFPSAINPYFTVSPGEVAIGQEITFKAYTKSQKPIWYYTWNFGDGEIVTTSDYKYKKTYHNPGTYKVSLTATVLEDLYGIGFYQEELSWNLQVKEKAKPWWKILGLSENLGALVNGERDEDATQNPQNTPEWVVITKKASEEKPIAGLMVHFEEATSDIDLSQLTVDVNLTKRKSVIYMEFWPEIIEEEKVLFIPSTGIGTIYLCPYATSLEEITPPCKDVIVLDVGESKNGVTVSTFIYNEQGYYIVLGINSTGGGEFGIAEKFIKDLFDYIQNLPDEAFKKNPQQRKNALRNKLEEVFVKIENKEYQDAINKLRNDIRTKADGDATTEDWIVTAESQKAISKMIDNFITYLTSLLL